MITCKQSTECVIKSESGVLTQKNVIELKAHLDDCSYCRLFAEQSGLISKAFQKSENFSKTLLSEEEKRSLAKSIENKILNL